MQINVLEKITAPLGGQEVELQQIVHTEGGMPMLRIRIREGKRFTIIDIDSLTAKNWGEAMLRWASAQKTGAQEMNANE